MSLRIMGEKSVKRRPMVKIRRGLYVVMGCLLVLALCAAAFRVLTKFQLFGESYRSARTAVKGVALTFDDGPHPTNTRRVLEVLARHDVKATFFMMGMSIEEHPEIARAVIAAGHEAASHSYSHPRMLLRSPSLVRSEIEKTDALLRSLGAEGELLFRSPGGRQFIVLPCVLSRMNKKNILWNLSSRDWKTQDADAIADRVLEHTAPGSIVLFHDGGGQQDGTIAALDRIIPGLKSRGYRLMTVSQMLDLAEARGGEVLPVNSPQPIPTS